MLCDSDTSNCPEKKESKKSKAKDKTEGSFWDMINKKPSPENESVRRFFDVPNYGSDKLAPK